MSLPLASYTSLALVKRQAQFPDSKLWKILFFSIVASGHLVFWQGTQDDLKMVSFLPPNPFLSFKHLERLNFLS